MQIKTYLHACMGKLTTSWVGIVSLPIIASGLLCVNLFCAVAAASDLYSVGERFRDCSVCPEMVVVPGGDFVMGSPSQEVGRTQHESPQHKVLVPKSFAIALYETKISEWKSCVSEGACDLGGHAQSEGGSKVGWREWKRTHPAVEISWDDSKKYVAWLTSKTAFEYRLPTEAEWEHAARGGTTEARFWDKLEGMACEFANLAGQNSCSDGYEEGAPVGSYRANAFGLYDMLGNVAEWVEDCWYESYDGAPTDGRARTRVPDMASDGSADLYSVGDCNEKVYRGGDWHSALHEARSASRAGMSKQAKSKYIGLRIVRALP